MPAWMVRHELILATLSLDLRMEVEQLDFNDAIVPENLDVMRKLRDAISRGVPAVPGKSAGLYPPPENRLIAK